MNGAGGTEGGTGRFIIGLIMMIGGGYVFLKSIHIFSNTGLGYGFHIGGYQLTTGLVLVPFIFGMGLIFFNARNYFGWFLVAASLIMLTFGVISSIQLRMDHLSAFDLIMILGLFSGGVGLFASSLKDFQKSSLDDQKKDS